MSLNASKIKTTSTGPRVKQDEIQVGNYMSRLVQVIDTGVRYKDVWDPATNSYKASTDKPPVQHIMTTYELLTEYMKDEQGNDKEDKPRWISEEWPLYGLDQDLATTTKRAKGIDPTLLKGGDWPAMAGDACQVAVVHKTSGRAKIGGVASAIKGIPYPELSNDVKVYTIDMGENEVFRSMPDWIQEKVKGATNWTGSAVEVPKHTYQPAPAAPQEPQQDPKVDNPY